LRLIWLRANTEFTAYYRQESLNGSAASFDILRLFSHHQMAITDSIVRIRDPAHRAFSEPAQLYAVRIFIPQYATTTARTTQAVSNAVSRAESLIRTSLYCPPRKEAMRFHLGASTSPMTLIMKILS